MPTDDSTRSKTQGNLTVHLKKDTNLINPRLNPDNAGKMVCRQFQFDHNAEDKFSDFGDEVPYADLIEFICDFAIVAREHATGREASVRACDNLETDMALRLLSKYKAVMLPLYLYGDDDLLSMRTSPYADGAHNHGHVGYICVPPKEFSRLFGQPTKENIERAKKALKAEVEDYSRYLRGEGYKFVIEDEHNNVINEVCGFFNENEAWQEAVASLSLFQQDRQRKQRLQEKLPIRCDVTIESKTLQDLKSALDRLQRAEATYRHDYQLCGAESAVTGRSWLEMRRAGDVARQLLTE